MHAAEAYKRVNSRYGDLTVFAHDNGAATQSLLTYGEWAENEITFLQQFVHSGSTVVDVGAYIGTHTLAFAHFAGPTGRVIAIEAQPDTFEVLRRNVDANLSAERSCDVQLENAIASCELAQISIPIIDIERDGSFGSTSLLEILDTNLALAGKEDIIVDRYASVAAITLDSLDLPDCALVKIDVEGVEDIVLCGAVLTLQRCSPLVYCECNSLTAGLRSMAVLENVGYKIFAHVVDAFRADNFFNVHENIFGDAREVALIGIPAGREAEIRSLPARDCELLLDIENADDLALALLNKPQYQGEVLRLSHAAKTGGVKFLNDYDVSKLKLQRENAFLHVPAEEQVLEPPVQPIAELRASLSQRDAAIAQMEAAIADGNHKVAALRTRLTQRDAAIAQMEVAAGDGNREIAELRALLSQRDAAIAQMEAAVDVGHDDIAKLNILLTQRHVEISEIRALLRQRDIAIAQLGALGAAKDCESVRINALISSLYTSTSWKLTSPLRWVTNQLVPTGKIEAMKTHEAIMRERAFEHGVTYTKTVALTFQPQSYADFDLHPELDEVFRRWTQGDSNRGLDFVRIWGLVLNCKYALQRSSGSIAELGIYQGQSAALLSLYAEQFSRKIYLFDTFSGFAETQFEADMGEGKKAAFKDTSLEAAQAVVGKYSGVRWIVGTFPASVTEEVRDETFAFVSIDCDIYEPVLEGLKFFWPRLEEGGMIFVHDYSSGYWPGATKAVDEFCAENGIAGCQLPDLAGSFILARGRHPK